MTWNELKAEYMNDHLSKPLKAPQVRIYALSSIEKLLGKYNSQILNNPTLLLTMNAKDLKADLAVYKANGKLNDAENSVINGLFKFLK